MGVYRFNRIWFPYPESLIEAGIQAMDTHSPLDERQARADCWYAEYQQAFLDGLKANDINTDARMVEDA